MFYIFSQKSDDILGRICHSSAFDIFDLYQALDTVTDGLKQQVYHCGGLSSRIINNTYHQHILKAKYYL